ncbi:CNP1-like family protein [Thiococcus pfennigii]|uniref:CNP1-like family protein n=1 Tax=Thiococcus pfennigii TaxID=1057 RepID=UPI00190770E5|nr:CNP1-like family protein [Thiococcus pfennigii]MBK1700582.1 hypothetical protein [Thiococcus pfennigii]
MIEPSRLLVALVLGTLAAPLPAAFRDDAFVPDQTAPTPSSVREGEHWSEGGTTLPPWPQDADLIFFPVDGPKGLFRYAIDGRNLAIGEDEVVRYTLVAESASGARNVSFEGIRCTPNGQYRLYAYGTAGRFTPVAETDWLAIAKNDPDGYRDDLWRTYLCVPLKFVPRTRPEILRALERGRVSRLEGTGFMAD